MFRVASWLILLPRFLAFRLRDFNRQPHLDNQTTVSRVSCLDSSAVKAHGARGYCQPQSGSSRLPVTRVFNPVKWTEDFCDSFFRHARSLVAHTDDSSLLILNALASERDFNLGSLPGVIHGITHDVLDGVPEKFNCSHHRARLALYDAHRAIPAACFQLRIVGHLFDEGAEFQLHVPQAVRSALDASKS